jgi:hypothetical protein
MELKMQKAMLCMTVAGLALAGLAAPQALAGEEGNVITLTQTPCQFVESEGTDHAYKSASAADCKTINAKSGADRVAASKVIRLKPGDYTFRVTNKNVPYGLGFYLRGQGITGRATLPSVSGGGLETGVTKDYKITLKPGKYYYSCPLNPTPDYELIVDG